MNDDQITPRFMNYWSWLFVDFIDLVKCTFKLGNGSLFETYYLCKFGLKYGVWHGSFECTFGFENVTIKFEFLGYRKVSLQSRVLA